MKRLEVEIPDEIHTLVLDLAHMHRVPARNIGGAVLTLTLCNVAAMHKALVPNLSTNLMAELHGALIGTFLNRAKKDASDARL